MTVALDRKQWTDEEFMALPDTGDRYEIVDGELVMSNCGTEHGYIAVILSSALHSFIRSQKLGIVTDSSTSFSLKSGNKRAPDISFIAKKRLVGLRKVPKKLWQGAPDLAIEILSPTNTVEEIHEKIVEYFENGAKLIWIINPQDESVLTYRSPQPDRLLKSGDNLDGEDVVSGFSFPVGELFAELDF